MSDFSLAPGTQVLVIGVGRSGLATADVLRSKGLEVIATDEKEPRVLRPAISEIESYGARFVVPEDLRAMLPSIQFAVLSPGVPLAGELARRVLAAKIPIVSEIEIAYRLCQAPIIAVSGTKGKSTTTALIGHLFRHAGKSVFVGGNIGNALVREVGAAQSGDWVVAEVSSFQLETIAAFKPRISLLLNLTADHLDRYASMDDYAEAKYRIFANQDTHDTFIGNLEDERIFALHPTQSKRVPAKSLWFTMDKHDQLATLYLRHADIWYAREPGDQRPEFVMKRSEIPLLGEHNVQNALAAMLACIAAGIDPGTLRKGVMSFLPMSHRLQTVAEIGGVRYVDDSKATNPGSVVAALRAFESPVILIAGGKSKGTDFREMGQVVSSRTKALILIGEAANEIASTVNGPNVQRARSMSDAVERARGCARPGDVVILSPGCASFDMFDSAEHRGDAFAQAVKSMRATAGA